MSVEAIQWALTLEHKNPTHKSVLVGLANHADPDGKQCHPSIPRLETYTGLHRASIIRAIQQMEALGILLGIHERGKRTRYELNLALKVVAQNDQSQSATSRTERPHQSQSATTTSRTVRPKPSLTVKNRQVPPSSPPTLLPEDFPDDHAKQLALTYWDEHERSDIDLAEQIMLFRAHHRTKGTRSKDWGASWTTWYANSVRFVRAPPSQSRKPEDIRSDLMKAALR